MLMLASPKRAVLSARGNLYFPHSLILGDLGSAQHRLCHLLEHL